MGHHSHRMGLSAPKVGKSLPKPSAGIAMFADGGDTSAKAKAKSKAIAAYLEDLNKRITAPVNWTTGGGGGGGYGGGSGSGGGGWAKPGDFPSTSGTAGTSAAAGSSGIGDILSSVAGIGGGLAQLLKANPALAAKLKDALGIAPPVVTKEAGPSGVTEQTQSDTVYKDAGNTAATGSNVANVAPVVGQTVGDIFSNMGLDRYGRPIIEELTPAEQAASAARAASTITPDAALDEALAPYEPSSVSTASTTTLPDTSLDVAMSPYSPQPAPSAPESALPTTTLPDTSLDAAMSAYSGAPAGGIGDLSSIYTGTPTYTPDFISNSSIYNPDLSKLGDVNDLLYQDPSSINLGATSEGNPLSSIGNAISGLKTAVGGTTEAGKFLTGNTGNMFSSAGNLASGLGSLGASALVGKLASGNTAGSIGSSIGSAVLGPVGALAGGVLGTLFGGFTGIGDDYVLTTNNPFTGQDIEVTKDPAVQALYKYNQTHTPYNTYNVGSDPYAAYSQFAVKPYDNYMKAQDYIQGLAKTLKDAGVSDYEKYINTPLWQTDLGKNYGFTSMPDPNATTFDAFQKAMAQSTNSTTPTAEPAPEPVTPAPEPAYSAPAQSAPAPTQALAAMKSYGGYQAYARGGNVTGYAQGGIAGVPEYAAGGTFLKGPGDGMSDSIPAMIHGDKPQQAALADGEFVIPADVVSHLGNGSSEAGSRKLYDMMDKIRHARTGRKKQAPKVNPDKFLPR